ncbi:MAG TPA: hypothetical protein PK677_06455 [Acidiphilium sp.]|nr:MAG: hypothetical protein B7Z67_12520 [Acidiphilium sp. 21-60-14]OYV89810.1 MAG: hypothetical protein B7Z57_11195 [Acidiphilium sp. 37-60-79]OZB39508.1 MAG: hypothetical protein B7X48_08575 [Acidiphilium sp. 34-60-192]HQT88181.1 hypothetical protein [Acidiphilium sp.]HQU24751.1 hypothetical protein [Acidiphilium sp.]
MNISPREAEQSLAAIETASQESRSRRAYRHAAPYIIGWGIVWAIGYTGSAILPHEPANIVWLALIIAMSGFSAVIMRRQSAHKLGWGRIALYTVVPSVTLIILVNLIANGFNIRSSIDIYALFIFIVAAAYAISGLKFGRRYGQLGVGLASLTAVGLWLLPSALNIYIFFIDAACLLLAGFWFRRA